MIVSFDPHISYFIFLLVQDVVSEVTLNGGVTSNIALRKFVCQGCSLSPFLFATCHHSLLAMLSKHATNGHIVV